MKKLSKQEAIKKKDFLAEEIKASKTFVYPTSTLYGIGANALDSEAVKKIRKIKLRDEKPFLIIAPSIDWIFDNCQIINEKAKKIIKDKTP